MINRRKLFAVLGGMPCVAAALPHMAVAAPLTAFQIRNFTSAGVFIRPASTTTALTVEFTGCVTGGAASGHTVNNTSRPSRI